MAFRVSRPCYANRDQVKRSFDIKDTARNNQKVDRAIEASSENIDGILHRKFYIEDRTSYYDWPNYQYAYPWRIWFDAAELADVTTNVPVVTSGGVVVPAADIFWGHPNYSPPFTYLELNRSTTASFGIGNTPQRDVAITGTHGYQARSEVIGTLAGNVASTDATITITDGSLASAGDLLIVDSERMLVTGALSATTGQTNLSGLTTDSAADDTFTCTSGAALNCDEIIAVDSERMLVVDINGNTGVVKRAWDGTRLAAHSAATTIYAYRLLPVQRGQLGTTAAAHTSAANVNLHLVPAMIRDLCIAEAGAQVIQETGGYSEAAGEGSGSIAGMGSGLADKWDEAETRYGRKARVRVI